MFLFNPDRGVTFVDAGAPAVSRSTTGTQVAQGARRAAQLTLSPGRIDPTNAAWDDSAASRWSASSAFHGQARVIVIGNHFDSKLRRPDPLTGRFQFPAQSRARSSGTSRRRSSATSSTRSWPSTRRRDVVVLGDLNDYQFSPALSALTTGTSDGSGKPT